VWDGLASRRRLRQGYCATSASLRVPTSSWTWYPLRVRGTRDDLHTATGRSSGQRTLARSGPALRQWRAKARLITAVFPRCSAAVASSCAQPEQPMSAPKRARTEQGAAGPPPPAAAHQAPGVVQTSKTGKIPRSHLVKLAGGKRRPSLSPPLSARITLQQDKRE